MNKSYFSKSLSLLKQSYTVDNYLPSFTEMENKKIYGRYPYEGYQRGWGLQFSSRSRHFSDVLASIKNDQLYEFAFSAVKDLTIVDEFARMNLFLILKNFLYHKFDDIEKNIIEFGSYRGGNAIFIAIVMKVLGYKGKIYACDTFSGMPETNKDIDSHNPGDFADTSLENLLKIKNEFELDNLVVIKGLFSDLEENLIIKNEHFVLAYIDCDIESSCADAYKFLKNRMPSESYLIFDDATTSSCIGATQFVESQLIQSEKLFSEQIWPNYVFRVK